MAVALTDVASGGAPEHPHRSDFLSRLVTWDSRFRARRALADLGPERLADLGLTASDIEAEAAKPVWRP
jgi:uncharacterized protein YjiS (DUF1127 family)